MRQCLSHSVNFNRFLRWSAGQPETVRKIYDASDSSAAKGPAVPNVPPVTAGCRGCNIYTPSSELLNPKP